MKGQASCVGRCSHSGGENIQPAIALTHMQWYRNPAPGLQLTMWVEIGSSPGKVSRLKLEGPTETCKLEFLSSWCCRVRVYHPHQFLTSKLLLKINFFARAWCYGPIILRSVYFYVRKMVNEPSREIRYFALKLSISCVHKRIPSQSSQVKNIWGLSTQETTP